jgi:hypothetical protein
LLRALVFLLTACVVGALIFPKITDLATIIRGWDAIRHIVGM